jgi:hypothetical protein
MPSRSNARARVWLAFAFLFLLLGASAAGLYYLSDLSVLQDVGAEREGRAALQGITDAGQIDAVLASHPANPVLQTIAMANRTSRETSAAIETLSGAIEPPSLAKKHDLAAASPDELEQLARDFKTAQANAAGLLPRYQAVLRGERNKLQEYARLHVAGPLATKLLATVDARHAETAAFFAKMLSAREDFYRAYADYLAFLMGQSGSTKVVKGQFVFASKAAVDGYNAASDAMHAAASHVLALEDEQNKLARSQQEQWLQFIRGF